MKGKILRIISVFLYMVFFSVSVQCFADAAADLEQANSYFDNAQFSLAEPIYQDIVNRYPGSEEAFQAQYKLAVLYVKIVDYVAAETATNKLLTDFVVSEWVKVRSKSNFFKSITILIQGVNAFSSCSTGIR